MSYFSQFEKGNYDIKGNGQNKVVTDLFTRVKVRSAILNEISAYDSYDVQSGERPEDVSFKHFGTTEFHWVILLTNDITDVYYDWPLSDQDFETYITSKYSNPDGIHHYEMTQSSGKTSPQAPDDYSHKIEVNSDTAGAQSVSNREYEQRLQDKKRTIKLLNPSYLPTLVAEFEALIRE